MACMRSSQILLQGNSLISTVMSCVGIKSLMEKTKTYPPTSRTNSCSINCDRFPAGQIFSNASHSLLMLISKSDKYPEKKAHHDERRRYHTPSHQLVFPRAWCREPRSLQGKHRQYSRGGEECQRCVLSRVPGTSLSSSPCPTLPSNHL